MHGKNAKATRFHRTVWALLALLAAVAMLLVCSMPASAEDTAGDGSGDTQSSQSQNGNGSGTWADQADGTVTVAPGTTDTNSTPSTDGNTAYGNASGSDSSASGNPSDATSNANADNATSDGTAVDGQQSDFAPADSQAVAPVATGDCAAVSDWDTLVSCVRDNVPADGVLVTIAKRITAPANSGPVTIGGNVTLTATDDVDPALTSSTGDAIFVVNGDHTLTIGKNANDASFSYKNAQRWLALVNKDAAGKAGTLVINNGTFDSIKTTGTGYDTGSVANVDHGTVTFNGGTFSNNQAKNGGVIRNNGGTLTVSGGTFTGNVSTGDNAGNDGGGVIWQDNNGFTTINNGTFKENKAVRGGVMRSNTGDITVNNGTFDGNSSDQAAGAFMQNTTGTMTVNGGTFSNNVANTSGGAIHSDGTLKVTAGTFTANKTYGGDNQGGGAISQDQGSTTITGGTFTGNAQTFTSDVQCTNDNPVPCRKATGGGGAIRVDGGSLIIEGGVTFTQNYSRSYGWGVGGGAIYVNGSLSVRNDSRGVKPKFDHNWSGIYEHQYMQDANGKDLTDDKGNKVIPNGGAGGAIFLQGNDKNPPVAYLMGGSFTNNSSGYLGGAIYTEENSVTYIAKAVAYSNTAGHFGGGLWLCPSGSGEASKGGNIALFDNSVDKGSDSNSENQNPVSGANGVEAGDDFAIMNPYHKRHEDTSFMLMDTWFTDRTEKAVTWYHDGSPLQDASGYDDSYQKWNSGVKPTNNNIAVSSEDSRYNENSADNRAIPDSEYTDYVKNLTLGWNGDGHSTSAEFHDRGVALKAVVTGTPEEQASKKSAARASAAVEITGNQARLSGGAFGTNGNVKFSSPYTASWSKVKNNEDGTTPTKATKDNQLAGSEWLIETKSATIAVKNGDGTTNTTDVTTVGGPFDPNFYPKVCTAGQLAAGDWENGYCWKEETDANGKVTKRSAIVKDNTSNDKDGNTSYAGFDNNPDGGAFDINNLANGKYTVSEYKAPAGYGPSSETYTFVVGNAQAEWTDGNSTSLGIEAVIGNSALPGVSWSKVDGDHTNEAVKDTEWKVTPIDNDGKTTGTAYTVTDCVTTNSAGIACADAANDLNNHVFADRNPDAGVFTLEGIPAGRYKLEEAQTPDGYWQSDRMTDSSYYWFVDIKAGSTDKTVPLMYHDGKDTTNPDSEIANKTIVNQKPNVQWSKVAKDNDELLSGSAWSLRGPLKFDTASGKYEDVTVSGKTLTTTVTVTDCVSENGATSPCSSEHNTVNATTGLVTAYADLDNEAGKFKVSGLVPAPDTATEYYYELTETRAPQGFVLSQTTYRFKIEHSVPTTGPVQICTPDTSTSSKVTRAAGDACTYVTDNKIANIRQVTALPFTGGVDAREWLLYGGAFAVCAAVALALVNEYRKRKGLNG
ncbi:prealbumin-like fold domain-containing protein [Bifidobacterium scaligerum]|uniref:SpaA-like prealbumin fold domain-containing protein n=1 Tax=Bifidobacterium scaligerum TaxID=2052656 RepID=A0A2M9HNT5_9BIFI|nr:prealbumin-like fold domain-containing protein [Bifidobacterium scaligerum]PJM78431.1 hypothetical protein CUU80_09640 [Bifidobacterium scaligerum]